MVRSAKSRCASRMTPPASRISSAATICPMRSLDRQARSRARAIERAEAIIEIDLDAIAANWKLLGERLSHGTRCAAVVSANAYGLGMAEVAPVLARAGCKTFFVANID